MGTTTSSVIRYDLVLTSSTFITMRRAQDSTRSRKEPAMIVCIPLDINDSIPSENNRLWHDDEEIYSLEI